MDKSFANAAETPATVEEKKDEGTEAMVRLLLEEGINTQHHSGDTAINLIVRRMTKLQALIAKTEEADNVVDMGWQRSINDFAQQASGLLALPGIDIDIEPKKGEPSARSRIESSTFQALKDAASRIPVATTAAAPAPDLA